MGPWGTISQDLSAQSKHGNYIISPSEKRILNSWELKVKREILHLFHPSVSSRRVKLCSGSCQGRAGLGVHRAPFAGVTLPKVMGAGHELGCSVGWDTGSRPSLALT